MKSSIRVTSGKRGISISASGSAAQAMFDALTKPKTPGPVVDAGHVLMFTVRDRYGSWTTSRVRGITGNSTSSRMAAAERLTVRLSGDAPYTLEQVGDCDDKRVYTFRLVINPVADGHTPPSELDRAGGAS